MPSLPLRIAILECDTPLDNTRAKYGGYGGVFTALLKAGADALNYPGLTASSGLDLLIFDVVTAQSYPSLENIDAILLTGSKHNSFDDDPWILKLVEFVKQVLEQKRVRIIGVCFGHQILGRALGAKVARSDKGWEISVTAMDLTKKGQELFGRTSLVCISSLPEFVGIQVLTINRLYTRCTEILCMSTQKVSSLWRLQTDVLYKRCISLSDTSLYKVIRSLRKRL